MCVPVICGLGCLGESFQFVGSWGGFFFPFLCVVSYKSGEKMDCILKLLIEKVVRKSPGQVNRLLELFQLHLRKHYNDRGF